MPERFDVVVVGAGPAGSTAALVLARAGRSVALVERGHFPGAKNMYGGVIYGGVLDEVLPRWREEAPLQRWVVRRATMITTATQSLTVDFSSRSWASPPYNGATAYRSEFDRWLADEAAAAGADLVCSTTATGLLRDGTGRVMGVRTDRPDGDLLADVVIACDGVNSFLAREAGLYPGFDAGNITLGAKEVLWLPREEIESRFGVSGREGVDIEILGCTSGAPGGGFLYTNLDTIAVGVVVTLQGLAATRRRPEQIIAELKAHPAVAPYVRGGELKEYNAHLIPEGGYDAMPELATDGMLVAGDAAGLCLAAGIWLEGVNYAIGSGFAAGRTANEALTAGDTSVAGLAGYRRRLEAGFVLGDHRKLRRAPHLVLSERMQQHYPQLVCGLAERVFSVDNTRPKAGFVGWGRAELRRSSVRLRDVARDAYTAARSYG